MILALECCHHDIIVDLESKTRSMLQPPHHRSHNDRHSDLAPSELEDICNRRA